MEERKEYRAGDHSRDIIANLLQIAVINKMLPKGYRFELYDTVKRQVDQTMASKGINQKRKKVSAGKDQLEGSLPSLDFL